MEGERRESPGQEFTGAWDPATRRILPSAGVTHVHLLRHGEVEGHTRRVLRGQLDVPLSSEGERQSDALAHWLTTCEPQADLVVSSDLVRCRQLGERIARARGLDLELARELREQDFGDWQGSTWAEVTARDGAAVTAYWDDYLEARPTGGESFADVVARVDAWWHAHVGRFADRRVVLVTHIGVIRALACRFLGVHPSQALRFAPAVGSHTSFSLSAAGAGLQAPRGSPPPPAPRPAPRPVRLPQPGRPLRIATSGSAGTGKTTLARRLADELELAYVEEGMRPRLERGLDLHGLGPDGYRALLRELWNEQVALEDAALAGSIADRSPLDFLAFWQHYGLFDDEVATSEFVDVVVARTARLDAVILLPWGALPLREDGVRSTNPFVQQRFHDLVAGALDRHLPRERLIRIPLECTDLEARVRACLGALATGSRRAESAATPRSS